MPAAATHPAQALPVERTEEEAEYYDLNRRVYAVFARFYDFVVFPIRRLRRTVAAMAGAGPGSRVLDVATGTGAQAIAFAQRSADVVGVDLSEAMLAAARRNARRANVTFQHADATRLPFDDGGFDVACISFALHEMPATIRREVFREMARVTKPGGTVVVVDYALPRNAIGRSLVFRFVKLYEREPYARFVRSDLRAELGDAGIDALREVPAVLGAVRIVLGKTTQRNAHG